MANYSFDKFFPTT